MNRAYCLIRDLPHYRREAFVAGLRACGFDVILGRPGVFQPDDVLVIWNRYGDFETMANDAERRGAVVIVAENGFIGCDADGHQFYQLGVGGYNGAGFWWQGEALRGSTCQARLIGYNGAGFWWRGDGDRLAAQGVDVAPAWREAPGPAGHIVIRGQRGIGPRGYASPPDWHNQVAAKLRRLTQRRIQIVPHPGSKAVTDQSHVEYLRGAHALVIWSSSVGVKALAMGVPVICEAPAWVCKPAAPGIAKIDSDLRTDHANAERLDALQRMAWAQWSLAEITTGQPFRVLLENYAKKKAVA